MQRLRVDKANDHSLCLSDTRRPTDRSAPRGTARCSAAGEPSSTASAVPSSILAIVLAIGSPALASQTVGALSSGRLARRRLRIGGRRRPARRASSGPAAARSSRSSARTRRARTPTSPAFQDAIAASLDRARDGPARRRRRRATPRPATRGSSARPATRPTSSIELDMTDEESVAVVDELREAIVPPAGLHLPADRLRPDHPRLRRAVREGPRAAPRPCRCRSLAHRPDPRLRLARRGRHAAARGRPRDPVEPRAHLPRRAAGRDEHLRPEHRDDARARARHRLLAVHRQPVPRGAAPRPDRRRGRRDARSRPRARPSRSAASRSRSGCPGCSCSRRRRSARSASAARSSSLCSVFFALTFLPAVLGMLGPRVNALVARRPRRAGSGRVGRPIGAAAGARRSRWERVAHAVMRRPIAVLVPTLAVLLLAGTPFLRLEQGVPGADIYPAGVESRDAYVALQTEFAPGETTPIVVLADVAGRPDAAGQHRAPLGPTRRGVDGARRASTGSRARSPSATRRPAPTDARAGRGAVRPAARTSGRPALDALLDALRPRLDGPPRRHQPAVAVAAGRHRHDPGHPGARRRRRHHDPGRRQRRRRATTSSSRRASARRGRSG